MTRTGFVLGAALLGLSAVVFMFLVGTRVHDVPTGNLKHTASVPLAAQSKSVIPVAKKEKSVTRVPVTYDSAPHGIFSDAVVQELIVTGVVAEDAEEQIFTKASVPATLCAHNAGDASASPRIVFNEIAWMGTLSNASDEWIELRNMTSSELSLAGWQLQDETVDIKIIFDAGDIIPANDFYLLERTDDATTPVHADRIYTGALGNTNEALRLWSTGCVLEDAVLAKPTWIAGDSGARKTMERDAVGFGWHTSLNANGTPKAVNSVPPPQVEPPPFSGEPSGGFSPPPVVPPSEPPPTEDEGTPLPDVPVGPVSGSATHVMISEIQAGTENGGAEDEFVELYNPTSNAIVLDGYALKKQSSTGSEANLVSSGAFTGTIPAHGFFLIAHKNYTGVVVKDLMYSANSNNFAYTNNTVVLYDASGIEVDKVMWEEIPKGSSRERRAWHDGACMSASGIGELFGNGCDTDSASDFEPRATPEPQHATSAMEL